MALKKGFRFKYIFGIQLFFGLHFFEFLQELLQISAVCCNLRWTSSQVFNSWGHTKDLPEGFTKHLEWLVFRESQSKSVKGLKASTFLQEARNQIPLWMNWGGETEYRMTASTYKDFRRWAHGFIFLRNNADVKHSRKYKDEARRGRGTCGTNKHM